MDLVIIVVVSLSVLIKTKRILRPYFTMKVVENIVVADIVSVSPVLSRHIRRGQIQQKKSICALVVSGSFSSETPL